MKTFKQFLNEEEEVKNLRDYLWEHCMPFIKESKHAGLLIRGVKGLQTAEYIEFVDQGKEIQGTIKTVRQNRNPLDSTAKWHKHAGEYFKEKFGFNARAEGMFCFGWHVPEHDIRAYGTPCIVIPIGEFRYIWSRKVEDFFVSIIDLDARPDTQEEFNEWLDEKSYKDDDFVEAINSKHEIMIKCDKYLAFPMEYKDVIAKALHI